MAVELIGEEQDSIHRPARCDWQGESTDTKPATGRPGPTFYELDTGRTYQYTVAGWRQVLIVAA